MDTASKSPMEALAEFNRQILLNVFKPLSGDSAVAGPPEFMKSLTAGLAQDAQRWVDIQSRYYQQQLQLWTAFSSQPAQQAPAKIVESEPGDRRFRAPEWQQP